jgi:hypothetical protein
MVRYNKWAGNEKGIPLDVTRCVEAVADTGRSCLLHQCKRKRGYGMYKLFCKRHARQTWHSYEAIQAVQEAAETGFIPANPGEEKMITRHIGLKEELTDKGIDQEGNHVYISDRYLGTDEGAEEKNTAR